MAQENNSVVPTQSGTKRELTPIESISVTLNREYKKQIVNFFNNEDKALSFLSGIVMDLQRNPKLLECDPQTLFNSYMMMAQLKLMPSGVSGEAYVLPYKIKGEMIAQFQLGYQGLVTLFYKAGVIDLHSEIVRKNDRFSFVNGRIEHEPNIFGERGDALGAFVIIRLENGGEIHKVMSKDEIMALGKKFSKSFDTDFSPWKEKNDPQLWMWKKTVLKQAAKLVPKNESINIAIAEDNKDSKISDRLEKAKQESEAIKMGALVAPVEPNKPVTQSHENKETQDETAPAQGAESSSK